MEADRAIRRGGGRADSHSHPDPVDHPHTIEDCHAVSDRDRNADADGDENQHPYAHTASSVDAIVLALRATQTISSCDIVLRLRTAQDGDT